MKGDLVALFDHRTVAPVARAIADDAGKEFTRAAARHTPKDTGRTAERWEDLPVRKVRHESGLPAWESGTQNSYYKARWLEHGVAPHQIRARGGEDDPDALLVDGKPVSMINHPGFGAYAMTSKAAAEIESELPALAQPRLSAWAAALETRADAGGDVKR